MYIDADINRTWGLLMEESCFFSIFIIFEYAYCDTQKCNHVQSTSYITGLCYVFGVFCKSMKASCLLMVRNGRMSAIVILKVRNLSRPHFRAALINFFKEATFLLFSRCFLWFDLRKQNYCVTSKAPYSSVAGNLFILLKPFYV